MPILTEKINIKVDQECKDFPVYLTWLNVHGGYSYWLFFKSHTEKTKTKKINPYIKDISDLENADATNDIVGKTAKPTMVVGAKILEEDMKGIQGLFESPKVLRLMNPETWQDEGAKWQRVLVQDGSLTTVRTGAASFDIRITLNLPFRNLQAE